MSDRGGLAIAGLRLRTAGLLLDVAVTAAVVVGEKEDRRLLAAVPLVRFLWRPLTMLAVAGSSVRWVAGERVHWRRIRRRKGPSTGEVLFDIALRLRPPTALVSHLSGVGIPRLRC